MRKPAAYTSLSLRNIASAHPYAIEYYSYLMDPSIILSHVHVSFVKKTVLNINSSMRSTCRLNDRGNNDLK